MQQRRKYVPVEGQPINWGPGSEGYPNPAPQSAVTYSGSSKEEEDFVVNSPSEPQVTKASKGYYQGGGSSCYCDPTCCCLVDSQCCDSLCSGLCCCVKGVGHLCCDPKCCEILCHIVCCPLMALGR